MEHSDTGSTSGAALKRKRPARIDIPIGSSSFGFDSPKCVDRVDAVEVEADGYSVYCKRGRRSTMEDRYSAVVDLKAESRQVFNLLMIHLISSLCLIFQKPEQN